MATSTRGIRRKNRYCEYQNDRKKRRSIYISQFLKNSQQETLQSLNNNRITSIINNVVISTSNEIMNKSQYQMGLIMDSNNADAFLRLNIGGTHFLIRNETVLRRQIGLLSLIVRWPHEKRIPLADAYLENTNEYYFERSASLFNVIYQFYLTGSIHLPENLCLKDILNELDYWCIAPDKYLDECYCFEKKDLIKSNPEIDQSYHFKHLRFGAYRQQIWNLIEMPSSSCGAQIFTTFSVLFVFISILGLVLGSLPEFQLKVNFTTIVDSSIINMVETEPLPVFERLELICIIWFIFEYVLKMLISYDRIKTFFQLLNIIDLLAILPFIIEISLRLFGFNTENIRDLKFAFLVIRVLRVLRVIRILKLGRYSIGLQMFGRTLKASSRQLSMMAMVVFTGVIFFSTLVYFIEKDVEGSQFYSIPAACWW
ncbi:putative voltage-gated potassium channel [Dirofilaria immitis]